MNSCIYSCLLFVLFCWSFTYAHKPNIIGLSPQDQSQLNYDSEHFVCKDGSKDIPFSRVNDDFCDCKDGSDEPGTSACPNGMFYCDNKPHHGQKIHSSLLFDGICDCCDGSDEVKGHCTNTCKQLAEEALKGKREQLANYRKGVRVKKDYIAQAVEGLVTKAQELDTKKAELEVLQKERDTIRAAEEEMKKKEDQKKEELRLKAEQQKQEQGDATENKAQDEQPIANDEVPATDENTEVAVEETDEEKALKEEEDIQEPEIEPEDDELRSLKDELKKIRESVHDLDSKIRLLEREITDINKVLEVNFGADKEFFPLYGKCFEVQNAEYTYELCPFDKVTQKPKHGGGGTSLGTWSNTQNVEWGNSFKVMEYTSGLRCWGGPDRSTKVQVLCDAENRISDPQEPNKCEYSLNFYTPAVCSEAHSLALQLELEAAMGSISHDEL